MNKMLILSHCLPMIDGSQSQKRAYYFLKELAQHKAITLGVLIDDSHPKSMVNERLKVLKGFCEKIVAFDKKSKMKMAMSCIKAVIQNESITQCQYHNQNMLSWVQYTAHKNQIKEFFALNAIMVKYLFCQLPKGAVKFVDFGIPMSQIWQDNAKHNPFLEKIYQKESFKMKAFEQRVANFVDINFFEHQENINDLVRTTKINKPTLLLENGIDNQYFNPMMAFSPPFASEDKVVLCKVNSSDEAIEAGLWISKLYPLLKIKEPKIKFVVIGQEKPSFAQLKESYGIDWIKDVSDVRAYLQHAKVVIHPIKTPKIASTFILEALAMEKPILCSKEALMGMEPTSDMAIWSGLRLDFWVKVLAALLDEEVHLPTQSNRSFMNDFQWDKVFAPLVPLLEDVKTAG